MPDNRNTVKNYVFIGGCPRSGTTLLGTLLNGSEECYTAPESQFKFWMFLSQNRWDIKIHKKLRDNFRFKLWQADDALDGLETGIAMSHVFDQITLSKAKGGEKYFVDHTPENLQHYNLLLGEYPDAKFIHLLRDPRSVFASVKKLTWGPNTVTQFIPWWTKNVLVGFTAGLSNPNLTTVRFEDLINEPKKTLEKLSMWLDIGYNPKMMVGDNSFLPDYTKDQHTLVGSEPDKKVLDKWKVVLEADEILYMEKKLGNVIESLGYRLNGNKGSIGKFKVIQWRFIGYLMTQAGQKRFTKKQKQFSR